jgi:hypothetical protein
MVPSVPGVLKPRWEKALNGRLGIEIGGLQARKGFKELFGCLLDGRKWLRCPAEFVLACGADLMPVHGGYPVLRFGSLHPDARDDRIGNFPREVGGPAFGKKHDLSDGETMGMHGAFLPC